MILYVLISFSNHSLYQEAFYTAAHADDCIMVSNVFLQLGYKKNEFVKMSLVGHDPRILEKVYKGVFYTLLDFMERFALESRFYDFVAETRYSHELADVAILRA